MEFWALLDRKCKTFSIRVKTNACLDSLAVDHFFLAYRIHVWSLDRFWRDFWDLHRQWSDTFTTTATDQMKWYKGGLCNFLPVPVHSSSDSLLWAWLLFVWRQEVSQDLPYNLLFQQFIFDMYLTLKVCLKSQLSLGNTWWKEINVKKETIKKTENLTWVVFILFFFHWNVRSFFNLATNQRNSGTLSSIVLKKKCI